MTPITRIFDTTGFPPRWKCGTWSPELGWTHILSDLAIFGAYMAIPISLAFFVMRRRNVPFPTIFWLFVAFILCCGFTHLIEAVIFYRPIYRFAGIVKALTAVVSWATVIALVRVMPHALRLPDIHAANQRMKAEIEERTRVQTELERARLELEGRSSELTVFTHRMRHAMESAWVIASQWSSESGQIVWEIGARRWLRELLPQGEAAELTSWSQILPASEFARFLDACRGAVEAEREFEFQTGVRTPEGLELQIRIGGSPDRRVRGSVPTITGMARLI